MQLQCPICSQIDQSKIKVYSEEVTKKITAHTFSCMVCGTSVVNTTLPIEKFRTALGASIPPKGSEHEDYKFN